MSGSLIRSTEWRNMRTTRRESGIHRYNVRVWLHPYTGRHSKEVSDALTRKQATMTIRVPGGEAGPAVLPERLVLSVALHRNAKGMATTNIGKY